MKISPELREDKRINKLLGLRFISRTLIRRKCHHGVLSKQSIINGFLLINGSLDTQLHLKRKYRPVSSEGGRERMQIWIDEGAEQALFSENDRYKCGAFVL